MCTCVCFISVFEHVSRVKSGSVFVCVGVCETLTALQGLFAPRQHSAGQHACRGQALQGQHVLALLPERQTETVCVCVCVWQVCVDKKREQVIKRELQRITHFPSLCTCKHTRTCLWVKTLNTESGKLVTADSFLQQLKEMQHLQAHCTYTHIYIV